MEDNTMKTLKTTSKLQLDPVTVEKELRAFETIHREAIDSKDGMAS